MSQPNIQAELGDAREQYEKWVEDYKTKPPHTPRGDCVSGCGKHFDCPNGELPTFEEWLEE